MEEFAFYKNWMEVFLVLILGVGLVSALIVPSAALGYLLILISSFFAGRIVYERKSKIIGPFIAIIIIFLIGYLIGMRYGNRIVAALLFVAGAVLSYNLFNKKILKDFRF